jgi:excinuclease ABC subunit C
MNKELLLKIENLPRSAGVYKFYDESGTILYIGKAVNLSNRVPSYFKDTHFDRPHIIPMIPLISNLEVIETENEIEALVLEAALIKQNMPKFNVMLKDDKSYAWIFIATKEKFPSVRIVRTIKKNEFKNGKLFGPFPSGYTVKRIFNYLRKLYPFCTCKNEREEKLYAEMGLCPGPNLGLINEVDYRKNIDGLIDFLSGRIKRPINDLEQKMREYSKTFQFEKAAQIRDKISDLKYMSTKMKVDFFESENVYVQKKKMMVTSEMEDMLELVGIKRKINRVECYDISNISGTNSFGSMTVAMDGDLRPAHYRIFKIKTVVGPDDPASLREVITRRISNIGQNVDESLNDAPDILLIDGAKSQLGQVVDMIPKSILLFGISKGRKYKRRGGAKRDEFWYVNRETNEITQIFPKSHTLLTRLRDEAHRFAIKHHRLARGKNSNKSILDTIAGIGPKRKRDLIKKFGSVEGIRSSTIDEIDLVLKNKKLSELLLSELMVKK